MKRCKRTGHIGAWYALYRLFRINRRESGKASLDSMIYGRGAVLIHPNGETEHVPHGSLDDLNYYEALSHRAKENGMESFDTAVEAGAKRSSLPLYQSHKKVRAIKIKDIVQAPAENEKVHASGDWHLIPENPEHGIVVVGHNEYIMRHVPEVGGYYVKYEDGYESYSPAKAFEEGYTRIEQ